MSTDGGGNGESPAAGVDGPPLLRTDGKVAAEVQLSVGVDVRGDAGPGQ
ncbi:hypothetical protein M1N45_03815 [Dehalococcoidia bacterium]|nr:hypothetical protein [Dehalococcoidia bacterium]